MKPLFSHKYLWFFLPLIKSWNPDHTHTTACFQLHNFLNSVFNWWIFLTYTSLDVHDCLTNRSDTGCFCSSKWRSSETCPSLIKNLLEHKDSRKMAKSPNGKIQCSLVMEISSRKVQWDFSLVLFRTNKYNHRINGLSELKI